MTTTTGRTSRGGKAAASLRRRSASSSSTAARDPRTQVTSSPVKILDTLLNLKQYVKGLPDTSSILRTSACVPSRPAAEGLRQGGSPSAPSWSSSHRRRRRVRQKIMSQSSTSAPARAQRAADRPAQRSSATKQRPAGRTDPKPRRERQQGVYCHQLPLLAQVAVRHLHADHAAGRRGLRRARQAGGGRRKRRPCCRTGHGSACHPERARWRSSWGPAQRSRAVSKRGMAHEQQRAGLQRARTCVLVYDASVLLQHSVCAVWERV